MVEGTGPAGSLWPLPPAPPSSADAPIRWVIYVDLDAYKDATSRDNGAGLNGNQPPGGRFKAFSGRSRHFRQGRGR